MPTMIGPKSLAVIGAGVELRVDPHLNPRVEDRRATEYGTSPTRARATVAILKA
jgi:hypothetical protein